MKIIFSHEIHPKFSFPCSIPPRSTPTHFLFRKEQACKKQQEKQHMAKHSYCGWTRQPDRRQKESETNTLLVIFRKHQIIKLNIYSEDLVTTHAGLKLATSVFVSPNEPCLAVSVDHALLVFSIPSYSYNISSPFPGVSLMPEWRDLMGASNSDAQRDV